MPVFYPLPHPLITVLAILLYTPLSLIALLLNLCAIPVFALGHRYFSHKFFYIAARHLLVADLLSATAQLFVAVPVSIMQSDTGKDCTAYLRTPFAQFSLTMETLAHLDTFHFVALQACAFLPCFRNERASYRLNSYGTIVGLIVWMWIAGLMLWFGFTPCAKRFDPATLHFYDSCYRPHEPSSSASTIPAMLNIWLTVLLLIAFIIYASGLSQLHHRISQFCAHRHFRHGSISISVVMPSPSMAIPTPSMPPSPMVSNNGTHSPKSKEIADRKRLVELLRMRELMMQGFLITASLALRFIGFFVLPWIGTTAFGTGVNVLNARALLNILGNILTLLSLVAHPLIYWWWNLRIRALAKEVVEIVEHKVLRKLLD